MPSTERALSPRQVARSGLCIGCGACAAGSGAVRMNLDAFGQFKPSGPGAGAGSARVGRVCPFSPSARDEDELAALRFPDAPYHGPLIGRYEAAYVGHAGGDFRPAGSSGGLTTWMALELLRLGLVDGVAHVGPGRLERGEPMFGYRISRTEQAVRDGARSRYFPVELSGVVDEIRRVPGRYAVVGIPCFIKAIQLLCADDPQLRQRIVFTLGLVCGHMKSARLAESFIWQLGAKPEDVRQFDFRRKDPGRPANWYRAEAVLTDGSLRGRDWWHLADGDWGAGYFQNSACDFCDDVVAETADIVCGDAWVEPYASDGRGTNVVVVRDRLLKGLLSAGVESGRIELSPVDAAFVVDTQAAGFRQRREGLAWRLARRRRGIRPRKRVRSQPARLPLRRQAIYAMRRAISATSHRVFLVARTTRLPLLYLLWALGTLRLCQGLAYSRGRIGGVIDWFFERLEQRDRN